ncbi:uncharacterized protein EV154DRAFT_477315 [Mucor mucedo]|uniref:uncharacterized protein n=1 Tax=Mucor mucedo TaxID=29922 RepID=UPI00221E67FC|nr:uncharacterized protein EV154DRAFT_477315 [Mucor mucedo]KAI7895517.1 hypothetical protein EV154DRAFT_477315 [Mucor mucedo]
MLLCHQKCKLSFPYVLPSQKIAQNYLKYHIGSLGFDFNFFFKRPKIGRNTKGIPRGKSQILQMRPLGTLPVDLMKSVQKANLIFLISGVIDLEGKNELDGLEAHIFHCSPCYSDSVISAKYSSSQAEYSLCARSIINQFTIGV